MPSFAQAILAAEKIGTRAEKHAILSGFNAEEQRLVRECYNPFRVYGIKKWDEPAAYANQDPSSYQKFFQLLDDLHERNLTGNLAKRSVTAVLGTFTEDTAKILTRVIKKDLKCGASRDTFDKLYPGLNIPRFDLMLAAKIEENAETLTAEILEKKYGLTFPLLAESKYDGNRLVAFVTNGKVEYVSRSGKDSDHLIGLFDDDLRAMEQEVGQPIVVDGEVLGNSFAETMKAKGSKNEKKGMTFWAFDLMIRKDWDAQQCDIVQSVRSTYIEALLKTIKATTVKKSKYKYCNSIQELRDFYAEVLAEGQNPDGTLNGLGEGLIVKDPNGLYEWDRSDSWRKWKPVIDLDGKIVGFEYGTKGTRLEHTVGRILVEGTDENGRKWKARCGSGLDDKTRADMLANWNTKYLDATAMLEAQEMTLAQNADTYSARFPVYIKIRTDK